MAWFAAARKRAKKRKQKQHQRSNNTIDGIDSTASPTSTHNNNNHDNSDNHNKMMVPTMQMLATGMSRGASVGSTDSSGTSGSSGTTSSSMSIGSSSRNSSYHSARLDDDNEEEDDGGQNQEPTTTLRRVSSRPRLVSWDAFEANLLVAEVPADHEEERSLKRKNNNKKKLRSSSPSLQQQAQQLSPIETTLSNDLLVQVFRFLSVQQGDVARCSQVNRRFRWLLTKNYVWKQFVCEQIWPYLVEQQQEAAPPAVEFVGVDQQRPLYKMYPRMCERPPTKVDETLFEFPSRWSGDALRAMPDRIARQAASLAAGAALLAEAIASGTNEIGPHLRTVAVEGNSDNNNNSRRVDAVQYTGKVGYGDRCVRSDHPLPRPTIASAASASNEGDEDTTTAAASGPFSSKHSPAAVKALWNMISSQSSNKNRPPKWEPVVTAIRTNGGDNSCCWDVSPRYTSYFEVSIRAPPTPLDGDEQAGPTFNSRSRNNTNRNRSSSSSSSTNSHQECVAIGIATREFRMHSRMPGWDSASWGWHSDDGGLFHGRGSMLQPFDAKYGVGDTVGCGVDYRRSELFFTKNGAIVGKRSLLDSDDDDAGGNNVRRRGRDRHNNNNTFDWLRHDVYPVVGIDTNALIECNYGQVRPFEFDVARYDRDTTRELAMSPSTQVKA